MAEERSQSMWKRPGFWVAVVVIGIPVLALAWWLGSPLFIDTVVEEDFPRSTAAVVPEDMTQEEVEQEMAAAAATTQPTEEAMTSDLEVATPILSGEFMGADAAHQGSGTATVYRLEDGSHVLRLEDFEVTNGPDLHVFLNASPDSMEGSVDLGSLKGNVGNQNYDIPADVDVEQFSSVTIYCVPFSVLFARADLAPAG